jgi:hypothetical protein
MIPRMHILHLFKITVLRYSASQKTKAHDNRELSFLPVFQLDARVTSTSANIGALYNMSRSFHNSLSGYTLFKHKG